MNVNIKYIRIRRFRSFGQVEIEASRLNIYSGKNNAGKSNILRALNLFFNFQSNYGVPYDHSVDYNKAFRGAAGGKREVQIEVGFAGTGDGALKDDFSIIRTFSEGSSNPNTQYKSTNDDIEKEIEKHNGNITRQFTYFLNKIEYLYIPAVRDKSFVRSLLLRFEQVIKSAAKSEQFNETIEELSKILNEVSRGISTSFAQYMQVPATASLSSHMTDVLGAIEINVDSGLQVQDKKSRKGNHRVRNIPIGLFSSGDGIVMAYLVHFLAFLTEHAEKYFIWGFEEPENSLEYSKVEELADQFYKRFSKQAQIFITTHSPAFINLRKKDGVSLYRVYTEPQSIDERERGAPNKQLTKVDKLEDIARQLSLLDPNDPKYEVLDNEIHLAEQSSAIEEIVCSAREERECLERERKKFEEENASLLKSYPSKIFICEDERGVGLWGHFLAEARIDGVVVLPSDGCCNNQVEDWAFIQSRCRSDYKPLIFRELDRDGMLEKQIQSVRDKLEQRFKKHFTKYDVGFLPVCEIENFALLENNTNITLPDQYDQISQRRLLKIDRHFTNTIDSRMTKMLKFTDDKENFPPIISSKGKDKAGEMLKKATAAYRQLVPGKELAKIIDNFKPLDYLMSLSYADFPDCLKDYLSQVANFFS